MIDSATFNNLKARVKAECQRRKYTGSVASYAGTAYDFTNAAAAGKIIRYEHYEKNAVPLTAIDGKSRTPRTRINQSDITEMQTTIAALEQIALTSTSTGCSASCTGLCYSACSGGCKGGCGGSCSGGCGSYCGGCDGSCYGGCNDNCAINCTNTCYADCASDCQYGCTGGCSGSCTNGCTATCYESCDYMCISECGAIGY